MSNNQKAPRELLCTWSSESFDVLVPAKSGKKYLKSPLWHKHVPAFAHMEERLKCNISGLDGFLTFETGLKINYYETARDEFAKKVIPMLESHYGIKARITSLDEWWFRAENGPLDPWGNITLRWKK